ncbi:MAG: lysylphosphatidylglycerol synthase domain-containing protein [Acidobacteriota bacterium]
MEPVGPSRPAPPLARRWTRLALVAAGLALVVWMLRTVGWTPIEENLRAIGGWFLVLLALYALSQAAFFLGWWAVMEPRPRASRLPRLFAIYLAGDSANYLAPGGVAGEPLKVHLLSGEMETGRALASVTLHKHVDLLAQWLFVFLGVLVALASFPLSPAARAGALAGVAILGAMLAGLTWALRRGTYGPAVRLLSRWKSLSERLLPHHDGARAVDDRIRRFYAEHRGSFAAGVALCFLGWCGGAVETRIVLHLLAPGQGWAAALGIEALSIVATTMLLFIPGRIGGAEGARTGICMVLGLTASQGVAYGLVRRARELVWLLPGIVVMLAATWRGRGGRRQARRVAGLANGEARP